jgi:hypothetical protein
MQTNQNLCKYAISPLQLQLHIGGGGASSNCSTTFWHRNLIGHQRRSNCHQQCLPTWSRSHVRIINRITYLTARTARLENNTHSMWKLEHCVHVKRNEFTKPTSLSWTHWNMYICIYSNVLKSVNITTVRCITQAMLLSVAQMAQTREIEFSGYNN